MEEIIDLLMRHNDPSKMFDLRGIRGFLLLISMLHQREEGCCGGGYHWFYGKHFFGDCGRGSISNSRCVEHELGVVVDGCDGGGGCL